MKPISSALVIFAAAIACGCTSPVSHRLKDIESYIQEYPDSALTSLSDIDTAQLKTGHQKALYSLLTAMARDKNDVLLTDTRLIEPAVGWYDRHGQDDHLTAALFYAGRTHYNTGDYPSAIISYQRARENARSVYWKGMCEYHMSMTYNCCYNNEEELKHALLSSELWKEYGDPYRIQQSYAILASAYNNNRLSDKADSLLAILCNSETPFYPAFRQRAELKIRWGTPDFQEIASLFEEAVNHGCAMSADNWYEYAYALFKCGDRLRAESIVSQLSSYGESISSCLWLGKMAEEDGDYQRALQYERTEKQLTDTLVRTQLSQSLFKAQAEQYRLSSEMATQRRDNAVLSAILISVLFAAALICMVYAFRKRRINLEAERERALTIAEKASELLRQAQADCQMAHAQSSESEAKLTELRRSFAELYQHQFSELGHLLDYSKSASDASEKSTRLYLQRTSEIMEEINRGEVYQRKFEARINHDLDDIMIKLRQDFPDLKESDFRFLSYVIVGFDATTRAIILNETTNNMRVKKARLIKKIADSGSPNALLYSCFLHPDK